MSEIEKALFELKALMKYRAEQLGYEEEFRGLGLTSRKNLCLHPSVKREKSGAVVDARCRSLTAGFIKEKKERGENVDLCIYHEVILHDYQSAPVTCKLTQPRILIFSNRMISFQTGSGPLKASSDMARNTNSVLILQHGAWSVTFAEP
jgi:hypothetical protein